MSTEPLLHQYQSTIQSCEAELERNAARFNLISFSRLFAFIASIALVVYTFQINPWLSYGCLLLCFILFVLLVRFHERISQQREQLKRLAAINQGEIKALNRELGDFADGAEFKDPEHPYSGDLDLFGPSCLFPYLSRCTSDAGRKKLASWLVAPAGLDDIHQRQEAVKELAEKTDWRHQFQAHGSDEKAQEQNTAALMTWMQQAAWLLPKKALIAASHTLPFFTVPLFLLLILGIYPNPFALALIAVHIIIIRFTCQHVHETYAACENSSHVLNSFGKLMEDIETTTFTAPRLQELQKALATDGVPASARVSKLAGTLEYLAVRHNPIMHLPMNLFLLWDLFWLLRLEKWREENRDYIENWLEVVSEFEALSSLGNLAHNHPHWCFPEVEDDGDCTLKAEGLGHLLLPAGKCVTNDIEIRTRPHLILITGSNMGGKSTWLRSVGTGLVFALAGGPVCATRFRCARVNIYTSMRTGDSLVENESTFYAELKCLKRVTEAAASDEPTLFLLDEILRGTNSEDRHAGSKALIHQLVRNNGVGLLATHDLELTHTEKDHPDAIELYYFEAEIKGEDIEFDYTLRPGVCGSRNAAFLMRRMGIQM